MPITKYNKLVRDKIPEIIISKGGKPITMILRQDEYLSALNAKLQEELNEYLMSGEVAELVDIVEVMHCILAIKGVSITEFQQRCVKKAEERGSFNKKIFLKEVIEN